VTRVHHHHQQHQHGTPAIKRSPAVSARASPAGSPAVVGLSPGSMAPLLLLGDDERNHTRLHVYHAEDGHHPQQQQSPSGLLQNGSARERWALLRAHFRLAALLTCRAAVAEIREKTAHTVRVLEATAATNADSLNAHECVACWERAPDTVLLDCGHVCLCAACARGAKLCPLCRLAVARFVVMRR
jgi:hypothetical protein